MLFLTSSWSDSFTLFGLSVSRVLSPFDPIALSTLLPRSTALLAFRLEDPRQLLQTDRLGKEDVNALSLIHI